MTDRGGELPLRELLASAAPRVIAALTRRSGDFAAAEDAVQEALLGAHVDWRSDGAPRNPAGWLYRVACRRLADHLDGERARRRREEAIGLARPLAEEPELPDDETESMGGDEKLMLLFLCCHPALSRLSAIALTLRALCGLTTAEIASAFSCPRRR